MNYVMGIDLYLNDLIHILICVRNHVTYTDLHLNHTIYLDLHINNVMCIDLHLTDLIHIAFLDDVTKERTSGLQQTATDCNRLQQTVTQISVCIRRMYYI